MAEPFVDSERQWAGQRWAPLVGVAAAVLLVAGVVAGALGGPEPNEGTGDEWLSYFRDNDRQIYFSTLLFFLGVILFVAFVGQLRAALLRAEGVPGHWTAVAFGSGIATAVMLVGMVTPGIAGAFSKDALEPSAAQALGVVPLAFFVGSQVFAAALLAGSALVALRTGALPAWLAWASVAIAVLLLTPIAFLALLIGFPLWVAVVSVLLWRARERRELRTAT
jgi:hypothetical protein